LGSIDFRVYWILDLASAQQALAIAPSRAVALQLRDRQASGRMLYDATVRLREAGHQVYVNDRLDVALAAGANGVHLRKGSLSVAQARAIAGAKIQVGVSLHSVAEVARAHAEGADFGVLSPIFASPSKTAPIGLETLAEATRGSLPVYALGGVDKDNAARCLAAGARGVAAIRAGLELARALAS
jgi:thiamine-phosphate pyrophosphorylase